MSNDFTITVSKTLGPVKAYDTVIKVNDGLSLVSNVNCLSDIDGSKTLFAFANLLNNELKGKVQITPVGNTDLYATALVDYDTMHDFRMEISNAILIVALDLMDPNY